MVLHRITLSSREGEDPVLESVQDAVAELARTHHLQIERVGGPLASLILTPDGDPITEASFELLADLFRVLQCDDATDLSDPKRRCRLHVEIEEDKLERLPVPLRRDRSQRTLRDMGTHRPKPTAPSSKKETSIQEPLNHPKTPEPPIPPKPEPIRGRNGIFHVHLQDWLLALRTVYKPKNLAYRCLKHLSEGAYTVRELTKKLLEEDAEDDLELVVDAGTIRETIPTVESALEKILSDQKAAQHPKGFHLEKRGEKYLMVRST